MKKLIGVFLAICLLAGAMPGAMAEDEGMTLRQQIWQKIMVSVRRWSDTDPKTQEERDALPGFTQMNDTVADFLKRNQPGGAILFAPSTPDSATTAKLAADYQAALAGAPALLIGIDQEGGRITRLGEGTSLPGNMAIGATDNPAYARAAGEILGAELKALGISVDFAPSLDVNNNAANPIINVRSFGSDPQKVAELGLAMIDGIQSAGVIPVVKHFPGHGDTAVDSHSDLPLVDKPLETIRETELYPFQAAVSAGVPMVMTAHIQYPALDDSAVTADLTGETITVPATLSRKILTDTLRGEMGFQGVVITDAMNMDAIAKRFSPGEALIRAFAAGVDIALMPIEIACPGDIAALEKAVDAVEAAVKDGRLSEAEIAQSVARILALKESHDLTATGDAAAVVASPAHRAVEREIADAAVTVLKNEAQLPIVCREGETVLLIGAYENECTAMRFGLERLMGEGRLAKVNVETYAYTKMTELDDDLKALIAKADAVVFDTEVNGVANLLAGKWQSDYPLALIAELNARGVPYCAISVCLPQDAALFTEAKALLAVYNASGMSDAAYADTTGKLAYGPNLPAALDVIFGAAPATGRLPIDIYALTEERALDLDTVLYPAGFGLEIGTNG